MARKPTPHRAPAEDALRTQGWYRLEGMIPPEGLASFHALWEQIEAEGRSSGNNFGPRDLARDPRVAALLDDARVRSLVRALLGEGASLRSCHGRSPPPGLGRQALHADWSQPVPPEGQLLANVFVLLDNSDGENGSTRIVPGSHRWALLPKGSYAQPHGRHPEEISLVGRAGDLFVCSSHLWHAGDANRSGARRRVIIAQFSRPGLVLPGMEAL